MLVLKATCNNADEAKRITDICKKYKDKITISDIFLLSNMKERKKGIALCRYWSSKKSPFIILRDDERPMKAFYTEVSEDIIKDLENFLMIK